MSLALLLVAVVGLVWLARRRWRTPDGPLCAVLALGGAALLLSQLTSC